jgi:hypothetical protein
MSRRHYKQQFDEECTKLLDKRKQSQVDGDNMGNVICEAGRSFKENQDHLKDKINEL